MRVSNWEHNSGKVARVKKRVQKVRSARKRRNVFLAAMNFKKEGGNSESRDKKGM
jgi:hypothetical protein